MKEYSSTELWDRECIGRWDVTDYVYEAANAFTRAALDDIRWAGDTEGRGLNPLDLSAAAWNPVTYRDLDAAWDDVANSPETQVENALGTDRVVELIALLDIDPDTFGDRLYYDQNGAGVGFWDMDFSRPEYHELSDLVGYHAWGVEYSYNPQTDPDGANVTLSIVN